MGDEFVSAPIRDCWAERIEAAFQTASQIEKTTPASIEWVVEPWAARGTITGIDGLPKGGGKTTFALRLCRAAAFGELFLGHATHQTAVVYLTEEPKASFAAALRRAGLLGRQDIHVLSMRNKANRLEELFLRLVDKSQERAEAAA